MVCTLVSGKKYFLIKSVTHHQNLNSDMSMSGYISNECKLARWHFSTLH